VGTSYPLIAYVLNSGGTRIEIYTMDIEGYGNYRLTYNESSERDLIFTPDGQRLVFESSSSVDNKIAKIKFDGSEWTDLAEGYNPRISPDGTKILYYNSGIRIMDVNGSNKQLLTEKWGHPRFSSDGSKVIFANNGAVYTMNSDGSNLMRLTDSLEKNFGPVFSPDDSKIAFFSDRNARGELYIMNSDGGEQTRLTGETYSFSWKAPLFFPDGDKILFVKWPPQQPGIYKININGGQEIRLSGGYNPKFSPDGMKIGFIKYDGDIYLMNLVNGQTSRLTNTFWEEGGLAFQPRY
jgi:Tol biopolymer transport system component